MRPKFILMLALIVLLFGGMVWLLKSLQGEKNVPTAIEQTATPAVVAAPTNPVFSPNIAPKTEEPAVTPNPAPKADAPANSPVVVTERTNLTLTVEERTAQIDQLEEWQRNDDKQSLTNIINYLSSPDKEVRAAAIEATKQFGSADAIPALKAAAESAESTGDKIAYLEAVEFLSLPQMEPTPITPEQAAKIRAQMEAKRQAKMQQQQQNAPGNPGQFPNPSGQPQ